MTVTITKITAKVPCEFEVAAIRVAAEVRYWEDADVNGEPDTKDGSFIPLRDGTFWTPIIDLETGRVRDWPEGTSADIHYKVCDAGEYALLAPDGSVVAERNGYVPDMLAVGESGYGDYIILKIGADGLIAGWKPPSIDVDEWGWNS